MPECSGLLDDGEARSALAFRVSAEISPAANNASDAGFASVIVLLPPAPGIDDHLLRAVRDAGWLGKIITLQPPRAVYHREEVHGFTWYHAIDRQAIEPSSFGDSLWHLERFVLDHDASDRVILLGAEEGASLALAAVPYLHDRIAGVVAIDGAFPADSWWQPPSSTLHGFPLWLIRSREAGSARGDSTTRWLTDRGARIDIESGADTEPLRSLREGLGAWLRKNGRSELRGTHV